MAYWPEVVDCPATTLLRRRSPRYTLHSLAYVRIDEGNGGIVRDLTERGVAIQAVGALRSGQQVKLNFDLLSPRVRVEASARVVWADPSGQAGIEFVGLPHRTQRAVRDWLLFQLLSSAVISGRGSILSPEEPLIVSAAARPPIFVEPSPQHDFETQPVRWGWFSLGARNFSIFVDALILLCAVSLFAISSLVVMGEVPPWPLAILLVLTSSTILVAVYGLLFSDFLCGPSIGRRLARLAVADSVRDEPQRFR